MTAHIFFCGWGSEIFLLVSCSYHVTKKHVEFHNLFVQFSMTTETRPLSNYPSVPANNLKSRLGARKYSKCMKTGHEASTSGYCSRKLKRNSKVVPWTYIECKLPTILRRLYIHVTFGRHFGRTAQIVRN